MRAASRGASRMAFMRISRGRRRSSSRRPRARKRDRGARLARDVAARTEGHLRSRSACPAMASASKSIADARALLDVDRAGDRRRRSRSKRFRAAASSSSSTARRDWPEGAEERCRAADAILLGAVGWNGPDGCAGHDARRQDGRLVAGDRQPHEARPLREHPAGALPARHEARHLAASSSRCGARRRRHGDHSREHRGPLLGHRRARRRRARPTSA